MLTLPAVHALYYYKMVWLSLQSSNRGRAMYAYLPQQSIMTTTTLVLKIHVCGDGSYQVCGQVGMCCRAVQAETENT